jgi:DNA polymerase-3 subunit epsilon
VLAVGAELEADTPLYLVTFCAVDLETTGGSPRAAAITEVGAVKYRGGERVGSFHTLVEPGVHIPRFITYLTGLGDAVVDGAPRIEAVLPSLLEFLSGSVFVAHNARFDFRFLNEALRQAGHDPLPPPPVCTARLARRVVGPDVPNVRLETLAQYFRTAVRPAHRALPDAEACAGVLHGLLELGGRLGILTLGDLHASVRARGQPHHQKVRLADHLPHSPGVYLFRGREGRILYVGKATDLRHRVKSYFYGDQRRSIAHLLARTVSVEGRPCRGELEALVLEARLIARHQPPHNRRGKTWRRYAYLRVDLAEAWARIKVVRRAQGRGAFLGPFPDAATAHRAQEALEDLFPIRRCTRAMGPSTRFSPCVLAGLGRCLAPCRGRVEPERYEELVRTLVLSLSSPGGLLEALERRMAQLAEAERFEEAALARDRLRALAEALARARTDVWLLAPGRLELRGRDGQWVELVGGSLAVGEGPPGEFPCPRHRADEVAAVRSWVARNRPTMIGADCPPAEPVDGGAELARLLPILRGADRLPT